MVRIASIFLIVGILGVGPAAAENDDEPIEEITAYGQKTLLNLKYAAYQAEDSFFNLFNELNGDDRFDVYCEKRARKGSRIRTRQCWSPFEREIDEDAARDYFLTGGSGFVALQNEGKIRQMRKKQAEMLKTMVSENPELQQRYVELGKANLRFAEERNKRCEGRIICSGAEEEAEEEIKK